jgi:hypothetical protein
VEVARQIVVGRRLLPARSNHTKKLESRSVSSCSSYDKLILLWSLPRLPPLPFLMEALVPHHPSLIKVWNKEEIRCSKLIKYFFFIVYIENYLSLFY